jgi:hypothetical protein
MSLAKECIGSADSADAQADDLVGGGALPWAVHDVELLHQALDA